MKKLIPVIIVLALVVFGLVFGRQFLSRKETEVVSDQSVEEEIGTGSSTESESEETSFGDSKNALLWSWGKTVKCTWEKGDNSGTYYMKDGKVRTEMTVANQKWNGIWSDNCNYSWTEGGTEGFKVCYEEQASEGEEETEEDQLPSQFQEGVWAEANFNCNAAVIPDSMFDLPEGITFSELPQIPSQ